MNLIPGSASIINGRFTLRLDALPKTQAGTNNHWSVRQKERALWRGSASLYAKMAWKKPPLESCRIICTRHSTTEPDRDNLAHSFKSVVDSLVDAKVIKDDKPSIVKEFHAHWVKAPPKKGYITVEVEAI